MTALPVSAARVWTFRTLLALGLISAALRLWHMLVAARYGIDFTDEGFYLVWIRQPFSYPASVTQFGFLYHPLDAWLGGDVARLRQANILITWALAWVLILAFFRALVSDRSAFVSWCSPAMLAVAALMATTFPQLLGQWLPTPSYNSLALQALLVAGTGMLLAERDASTASVSGWGLLGIGGWLAFMAKPSTAIAVAAISMVYLVAARKFRFGMAVGALLLALLLLALSAWAIDGSVPRFVQRLQDGLELIRLIGVEQPLRQLLRIDFLRMGTEEAMLALFTMLLVSLAALGSAESSSRWLQRLGWASLLCLALASMSMALGWMAPTGNFRRFRGLATIAIPCAAVIATLLLRRSHWDGGWARKHLAVALGFIMLPHAFAFGTGNNYWHTGAGADIFWILAGLAIWLAAVPRPVSWQVVLPFALGVQFVGMVALQAAMAQPYRQAQVLTDELRDVAVGDRGSRLMLASSYADYVTSLGRIAAEAGFKAGTPVIDLTGHAPGALFGLGANSVGQPWLLGGYPGSDAFALKALALVPCEAMVQAWVLVEPKGPRPLSAARVLASAGLRLEQDYRIVGSLPTPPGYGDYANSSVQSLLQPLPRLSQALENCRRTRELPQ